MTTGAHPNCDPVHTCQEPSGRACYETGCDEPAGTRWGPYWCPDHDKERLDRIDRQLEDLAATLAARTDPEEHR